MATGRESHIVLPAGPVQPRRLLDSISRIPTSGSERWLDGVTWEPTKCRALTVDNEDACATGDIVLTPVTCDAWETQLPFRLTDAMSATTLDLTPDEVGSRLSAFYNRAVSAAFAKELISGAASGGMSLSSEATAPNGAAFGDAATPIWNALTILEEEIAERLQGGAGFIFLTPGLLAQARLSYGLTLVDSRWKDSYGRALVEGRWETPSGNIVISDAGFLNPPPPTGQTASGAGEDWMYASGPVFFESTAPSSVGNPTESLNFTRNTFTRYVQGYGILVFDPCPVTAVLASYALEG